MGSIPRCYPLSRGYVASEIFHPALAWRIRNTWLAWASCPARQGTLTRLVPRELVDEVVLSLGRKEQRKNKLPARVVVYFVMALALFCGDGYEEVMHATRTPLPPRVPAAPRDAPSVTPGAPTFTEVTASKEAGAVQDVGPRCGLVGNDLLACFVVRRVGAADSHRDPDRVHS